MTGEDIAPGFEGIGEVRGLGVGGGEIGLGADEVTTIQLGDASRVIDKVLGSNFVDYSTRVW